MASSLLAPVLPTSLPYSPLRPSRQLARLLSPCLSIRSSAQGIPSNIRPTAIHKTLVMVSKTLTLTQNLAEALVETARNFTSKPTPGEMASIEVLRNKLSMAGMMFTPLCFAAISTGSVNTPLTVVASGMAKWLELYSGVLMVRVLLSWFPNIPWERQPLQAIRDMCDPYLNLFRNIVPPLFNALDVSPLLAFLVLGVLTSILNTTIQT